MVKDAAFSNNSDSAYVSHLSDACKFTTTDLAMQTLLISISQLTQTDIHRNITIEFSGTQHPMVKKRDFRW